MDDNERKRIWEEYKRSWENGSSPDMDINTFGDIFHNGRILDEAITLIGKSKYARKTLEKTVREYTSISFFPRLEYGDISRVWSLLVSEEVLNRLILKDRELVTEVGKRVQFVHLFMIIFIKIWGRQWIREKVSYWWRKADFLEEEKDEIIRALAEKGALNWDLLMRLGPDAVESAQRLIRRGDIYSGQIDGVDYSMLRSIRGSQSTNRFNERIGSLLQPVVLALDIRDSGLKFDELNNLNKTPEWRHDKIFDRFRRHFDRHDSDIFAEIFSRGLNVFSGPDKSNEINTIRFPLIRFLHLQVLLEAPSLSQAVSNPEMYLTPEIVMFTIGRDAVIYAPELRILRDTDRRWRARWVESAGEALSVLFLESTVNIDITTLSRIPERRSGPTPDFHAETINKEPIVFESKGASSWDTHLKQRNHALKQLGKQIESPDRKKKTNISWAGKGRAFALSFFAATQGDDRPSLLHADDPVFDFDDIFSKNWKEDARRKHFAAVLEAAHLYETADNLRQGLTTEGLKEEHQVFTIDGQRSDRETSSRFIGNFLPVQDIARRLKHPDLRAIDALKIFVGIDNEFLRELLRNRLPGEVEREDTKEEEEKVERKPITIVPDWGVLPGLESDDPPRLYYISPPRGVYSLLADGSFLAVELK